MSHQGRVNMRRERNEDSDATEPRGSVYVNEAVNGIRSSLEHKNKGLNFTNVGVTVVLCQSGRWHRSKEVHEGGRFGK